MSLSGLTDAVNIQANGNSTPAAMMLSATTRAGIANHRCDIDPLITSCFP
jgi:hypothetical protein